MELSYNIILIIATITTFLVGIIITKKYHKKYTENLNEVIKLKERENRLKRSQQHKEFTPTEKKKIDLPPSLDRRLLGKKDVKFYISAQIIGLISIVFALFTFLGFSGFTHELVNSVYLAIIIATIVSLLITIQNKIKNSQKRDSRNDESSKDVE